MSLITETSSANILPAKYIREIKLSEEMNYYVHFEEYMIN